MAPRSTLDASKLVLTTGAGCLVFARAHLGFVPWEFVPSVFSAFGSSIWGTSTGRSSTLTDLAFCTRTVLTTRTTRSAAQHSAGPGGEAYRMLREGMRFVDPTGLARCFLITSADESEGKSTVAGNLASALAAVGRRVILVEADMRRPAAAAQLGISRNLRSEEHT